MDNYLNYFNFVYEAVSLLHSKSLEFYLSFTGVAVSGVVIDVNSIPKSNLISLKTADGSEVIQKCHVVSQSGACAQVTD